MFQIRMMVRAIPLQGGSGTEYAVSVLNDTGSNLLNVWDNHAASMGIDKPTYTQYRAPVAVDTAAGTTYRTKTKVQICVMDLTQVPLSDWFEEDCVVVPQTSPLLSGQNMRNELYFATAKGNRELFVGKTKNSIVMALPAL
jgi:hypothetical protein